MTIINLTPHDVVVVSDDGSEQTLSRTRLPVLWRERRSTGPSGARSTTV